MSERWQQELLAVSGLESISALQLQDLAWKTREQLFIALFHEHTPSQSVAEELRVRSRDRRLERKTERSTDTERDVVRRNEERFRGDFMEIVATELARLGAPALYTWQRLVNARGPRRSLTEESTRREDNNNSSNNNRSLEDERAFDNDDVQGPTQSASPIKKDLVLPQLASTVRPLRKSSRVLRSQPEWNADTTCDDRGPDARAEEEDTAPEISIHRVRPPLSQTATARSGVASKLQRSQLQSLQHENTELQQENKRLRDDISTLETLVTTLQNADVETHNRSEADAEMALLRRRLALSDAQNVQLRRQLSLLHDALQERETVETALQATLCHWQDATQAGADREAPRQSDGKPARWMFAAPTALLDELRRLEQQLHTTAAAAAAAEAAFEGPSLYQSSHAPTTHLRLDRLRALEKTIADVSRTLVAFHERVINDAALTPTLVATRDVRSGGDDNDDRQKTKGDDDTTTPALLRAIRSLVLQVGALGAVVTPGTLPSQATKNNNSSNEEEQMTAAKALKTLRALTVTNPKEREKAVVAMLRQIAASEAATQTEMELSRRVATYWERAWMTQRALAITLLRRARRVVESKQQWWTTQVATPWRALEDVWRGFERVQTQGIAPHKNQFLPLLVETLARDVVPSSLDARDRWQQQCDAWTREMDTAMDDFLANCKTLQESTTTRSTTDY
ncbi:hypothetical protein PINS_up004515 [Pythium insidiosum]|nr:hypothetical protein PINS_up004515 [Pythium insidiosum]